ncbi:hypothetical protein ACJX0J_034506, partial [Zea mays]
FILFMTRVELTPLAAYVSDNWQFNKFWSNCKIKVLEIVGFSLFRPRTVNFDHKTDILFHKAESLPSCQIADVNNLCIIWTGLKLKYLLTFMLTPPYKACEMIVYNNIPLSWLGKEAGVFMGFYYNRGNKVITISATQKCFLYALFHFGITYIPPPVEMNQWNKMYIFFLLTCTSKMRYHM